MVGYDLYSSCMFLKLFQQYTATTSNQNHLFLPLCLLKKR